MKRSIYALIVYLNLGMNTYAMETTSALNKIFFHLQSNLQSLGKKSHPIAIREILKLMNFAKESGMPKEQLHLSINDKTGYYSAHFGYAPNKEFIMTTGKFTSITKNCGYFVSLYIKFTEKERVFGHECRKCYVTLTYFNDRDSVELIVNFGEKEWVDETETLAVELERQYLLDGVNKYAADWDIIPYYYQKTSKYIYYESL